MESMPREASYNSFEDKKYVLNNVYISIRVSILDYSPL